MSTLKNRPNRLPRRLAVVGLVGAFTVGALGGLTTLAHAQGSTASNATLVGATTDARWQAWLGCWKPLTPMTQIAPGISEIQPISAAQLICVVPGPEQASIEIVNFSSGQVTERTLVTPGGPVARQVDGCAGSEESRWSADGQRVLMSGLFQCGNGITRKESGVMSIDADGQWVQSQSVNVNGNVSVYVARFIDTGMAIEGVRDGAIVERPILNPRGERLSPPRDDCVGTESVTPSADGSRVTVQSDYLCTGGLRRVANATMQRGTEGQWIHADGRNITVGNTYVRAAAGAPVSLDDVLEVAKAVDPAVTEAWLSSRQQQFVLNGTQLAQLADAGMAPRVIDMLVAVSNPDVFVLRPNGANVVTAEPVESRNAQQRRGNVGCRLQDPYCNGTMGMSWLYGANRYYGWDTYLYRDGFYGNRYGYPYSNGVYGGGYYGPGYYTGNTPVVIVTRDSEERGKAVNGRGYTRGTGSSSSGSRAAFGTERFPAASGSAAGSSGSGSSSAGSTGSSSSGGSSESTGRTAKPRGSGPPDK